VLDFLDLLFTVFFWGIVETEWIPSALAEAKIACFLITGNYVFSTENFNSKNSSYGVPYCYIRNSLDSNIWIKLSISISWNTNSWVTREVPPGWEKVT